MSRGKILFQMSGSIACYKACDLISRLRKAGHELEVVATPSALEFIGEATIEGLTGNSVRKSVFERGKQMDHIHLARWADLMIVCPATANTISKLAAGIGDDLISTLFLAHDFTKPYLVAPAMNATMMAHPAVSAAIGKLKSWGVEVLPSGEGHLACGETGEGRLLEPADLFTIIESQLNGETAGRQNGQTPHKRLEILVTAGGTREPIDSVRSIANFSTGRTGALIADYLSKRGHRVTLLRAADAVPGGANGVERTFSTFAELGELLEAELSSKSFDAVIHAAAVSDFAVDEVVVDGIARAASPAATPAKIGSDGAVTLVLRRNPKLVDGLRAASKNPEIKIVAFKLTDDADGASRQRQVSELARRAHPDFIVHNDRADITRDAHSAALYALRRGGEVERIATAATGLEIAERIEAALL